MNKLQFHIVLNLFFIGLMGILIYIFFYQFDFSESLIDYITIQSITTIFILHLLSKNDISGNFTKPGSTISVNLLLKLKRAFFSYPIILIPFFYIIAFFINKNIPFTEGAVLFALSTSQLLFTIILYFSLFDVLTIYNSSKYTVFSGYFSLFIFIISNKYNLPYLNLFNPFASTIGLPVLFFPSEISLFLSTLSLIPILFFITIYIHSKYIKRNNI